MFYCLLAAVGALCVLTFEAQAAPPQYTVLDLGTLGGLSSTATGINDLGQITGHSYITGNSSQHAFLWDGTSMNDLGTLGGVFGSYGVGINDSGQVTGYSFLAGNNINTHAVLWNGTNKIDLGGTNSGGIGINVSGQIAGTSRTGNGPDHATLWNGTTPTDLGTIGGQSSSSGAINDLGHVTGYSDITGNGTHHAFRFNGTSMIDLGTLGGNISEGWGINASGQIVGESQTIGNGAFHAVLWNGTTPSDLGTLGGTNSFAWGINALGDVTGMSDTADNGVQNVFLYTGGTMYDLYSLLIPGSGVTSMTVSQRGGIINDFGQIAATGIIGGQTHALLLSPVAIPEPSSALLIFGSGWVFLTRARRVLSH